MSWEAEFLREARSAGMIGKDVSNPSKGKVLLRHYYTGDNGLNGHVIHVVELEFENVIKQEIDKEATFRKAKDEFKQRTPNHITLLKTKPVHKTKLGNLEHPEFN